MKKILLAAALILGVAGAATAGELAWLGSAEYATQAETFETKFGAEWSENQFSVTAFVIAADTPVKSFDFAGVEVIGAVALNKNFDGYVKVEADEDLKHTETTFGVAFRF